MGRRRGLTRRLACAAAGAWFLAATWGCATDSGFRNGPSLEDLGGGLVALGAAIGAGFGLCALTEAGGGENIGYLGASPADYDYYDPWR